MKVHYFDADGFYTHSGELPINPVTGVPFDYNPDVCTPGPLPQHNPEAERVRWVAGSWAVEVIPAPPQEPEPEPKPEHRPQYPRFIGNEKLDLFTLEEQLAVVTATMTDPQVKLMYDRMIGAAYLSYEDPETDQGLSLLVSKGLITQERKYEIVSAMLPKQ